MADAGQPQPLRSNDITIVRSTDPSSGQVVTKYVSKATGLEVGLPPTYHLTGPVSSFAPPPS